MFKSKLIKLADYKIMKVTDDMCGTPMGEDELKEIFDKLAKRNVVTTDVEAIEKGDIEIIDLKGNGENLIKKILY